MRLEGLRLPTVVLATILEPDLWESAVCYSVERNRMFQGLGTRMGTTYLDFFLTERDAVHDTRPRDLIRFGVLLVLRLQNGVVLRAAWFQLSNGEQKDACGIPVAGLTWSAGVFGELAACCRRVGAGSG